MTDRFDPSDIRTFNPSDNDSYVPVIDPAFVVLGMLNEYMGRVQTRDEAHVETFFPAEKPLVDLFTGYLRQAAASQNFADNIDISVGAHGHITVSSTEAARFIASLYDRSAIGSIDTDFTDDDGRPFHVEMYGISEAMFAPLPDKYRFLLFSQNPAVDQRFSYLLGAHLRYGQDNQFELANAAHKVDLIIDFLERLGANWVSKVWTLSAVPCVTRIRFAPGPCLARLLSLQPMEPSTFQDA